MTLYNSDDALITWLQNWITALNANGFDVGLFTNNYSVVDGVTLSDLTEAAFSGYARVTLNNFSTPPTVSGHVASSVAGLALFSNTSGSAVDVYGYFIVDHTSSEFLLAENFPTPPVSIPAAGAIAIKPQLTLQNLL